MLISVYNLVISRLKQKFKEVENGREEGGKGREGGEGNAAVNGEMVGGLLRNDQIPFKTYKN